MGRPRSLTFVVLVAAGCGAPSALPLPPAPRELTPWVHEAPPPPPKVTFVDPAIELRSFVGHFTGEAPRDCGLHRFEPATRLVAVDQLESAVVCTKDAALKQKPSWTFQVHFSMDAWSARGLLGTADGTIYRFSYDGDPCGSTAGCTGDFRVRKCPKPQVVLADRPWPSKIKDAAISCY